MGESRMINFGGCLDFGIKRLTKNPVFYIVGFVVLMLVQVGLSQVGQGISFVWGCFLGVLFRLVGVNSDAAQICAAVSGGLIGVLVGALVAPFYVGYLKGIRKECQGITAQVEDVFSGFAGVTSICGNWLLCALVTLVGFVFCVIPAFVLWPMGIITSYFLARGQIEGLTAFVNAWNLLRKRPILILWFNVLALFSILGIFVCCVGALFTMPVAMAAMCKLVEQALDEDSLGSALSPAPVP